MWSRFYVFFQLHVQSLSPVVPVSVTYCICDISSLWSSKTCFNCYSYCAAAFCRTFVSWVYLTTLAEVRLRMSVCMHSAHEHTEEWRHTPVYDSLCTQLCSRTQVTQFLRWHWYLESWCQTGRWCCSNKRQSFIKLLFEPNFADDNKKFSLSTLLRNLIT